MDAADRSALVKSLASELGFSGCGIARAGFLEEDARRLESWLRAGYHGKMQYLENHFDKRVDPRLLVPGARSVVTLTKNYFPAETQDKQLPGIAKYAFGTDYHELLRARLRELLYRIGECLGAVEGRGFVDSAPVLERSWAVRSGLGWLGKNGNLISKKSGSFFFLATLITDLDLAPDPAFTTDHCGSCTRCMDACPTDAFVAPGKLDASRCISYLTIELRDEHLPETLHGRGGGWIFGCDTCQDVCPWNRFSRPHDEPGFQPIEGLLGFTRSDWEQLTEERFRAVFKNSPLKRAKWSGIRRNLKLLRTDFD